MRVVSLKEVYPAHIKRALKKLNIVVHAYNLSIQEARVEGVLQVQSSLTYTVLSHPGLHCETSSNTHVQEHMHDTHTHANR